MVVGVEQSNTDMVPVEEEVQGSRRSTTAR